MAWRSASAVAEKPAEPGGGGRLAGRLAMGALMSDFDPSHYGPAVAALLEKPRLMPLGPGEPNPALAARLDALDEGRLFSDAALRDRAMASACLAGLWLYVGDLDQAHRLSQSLESREGSYWHGIMHRREGDYPNAKYWFRRVGSHPIFPALQVAARDLARAAKARGAAFLELQSAWDPHAFVDFCEAARGSEGAERLGREIQQREWQLLFDYCHRRAVGDN